MRILFAGTPEFAQVQLQALLKAGFKIELVLTQPDRPSGRGQKLTPSPVKRLALEHNIPVAQPTSLKHEAIQKQIAELKADLMIVCAYGMLLPKAILELPKYGCWNIHASLLPRWRGAAPIQYALLKGDQQTGICLMQMDEGLDTGDVLLMKNCPISTDDTTGSLLEKLAVLGAETLIEGLQNINALKRTPQSLEGITHAPKITKEQAHIDWNQPSVVIERLLRALSPNPGAYTFNESDRIKIVCAKVLDAPPSQKPPGSVMDLSTEGMVVATQDGLLQVSELQLPGKSRLPVKELLNANPNFIKKGTVLK